MVHKVVAKSSVKSKEEKRTKKVFSLPGQRFEAPEEVCPLTPPTMMDHVMSGPMNLGIDVSLSQTRIIWETSRIGLVHRCVDRFRHGHLDKKATLIRSGG